MIKGLIFDFDGLMVETEEPGFLCVRDVFHAHGVDLPTELWAQVIGGTGGSFGSSAGEPGDVYDHLEAELGRPVDRDALRAQVRERHGRMVDQLPLQPGVAGYIADAQAMGLKLAVASSSSRQWVAGHLERLGVLDRFDAVVTRDDVARTKPEPDLYRAALAGLSDDVPTSRDSSRLSTKSEGLSPGEAIALEDSPNGVTAAKRAGLFCVAVPNPMTRDLPLDHADLRLASLADVPLRELVGRVGN